jgi:hypothetical protein
MAFTVLRVSEVGEVVKRMRNVEKAAYDAAVDALKGEGCRAGGKLMYGLDGDDFPICQRSLYRDWRMSLVFKRDDTIVIIAVERHSQDNSSAVRLAEIIPGLSPTGRRRSEQPPCCDTISEPPHLSPELEARIDDICGA